MHVLVTCILCVCGWMVCIVLGANLRGDKCGLSLLAHHQGQTL